MSYCRIGADSDVYVYHDGAGWHCCGCKLEPDSPIYTDHASIIIHLQEHIKKGDKVPWTAVARLAKEAQTGENHWLEFIPESEEKAQFIKFMELSKEKLDSPEDGWGTTKVCSRCQGSYQYDLGDGYVLCTIWGGRVHSAHFCSCFNEREE